MTAAPWIAVLCDDPAAGTTERAVAELRAGLADIGPVRLLPVLVGDDGALVADVTDVADEGGAAAAVSDVADAGELAAAPGLAVALVSTEAAAGPLVTAAAALVGNVLLLSPAAAHDDLGPALDAGALRSVVRAPTSPGTLAAQARAQLARWLRDNHPGSPALDALTPGGRPVELPASDVLRDLELDEHQVAQRLLVALDRALGPRPRLAVPAGVRLTHQDADVDGVLVVVSGSVALDRSSALGELRLHHASTGPVVGLLSLTQQRRAFFTARTTTPVVLVHLSIEQLDLALHREPEVGAALAATTVRALAGRLRRAEQLQLEKRQLARELEGERARLAAALDELEATRFDLVESERLATLGELSAGVAHELNNPVAALVRAASFVRDDLDTLLAQHPDAEVLRGALAAARDRAPRSTAEQRAVRRALADATGDRALADRLAAAGVDDPALAATVARDRSGELTALVETANGLGTAVRNLELASERIGELVASLRAYARPTADPVDGVDVRATVDDTLRLVAHRLVGIEVTRHDDPVPPIRAHPAQLGQVWTNILTNAAEAATEDGGTGRIEVRIDAPDPEHVRVAFTDDGPGLPEAVRTRVFEPRFSTKRGAVRYGLGLGLAIARRIVDGHGGTIDLTSRPGATTVTVVLPTRGPVAAVGPPT